MPKTLEPEVNAASQTSRRDWLTSEVPERRQPPNSSVITVRLRREYHGELVREAEAIGISLNKLCIAKLAMVLPPDEVERLKAMVKQVEEDSSAPASIAPGVGGGE